MQSLPVEEREKLKSEGKVKDVLNSGGCGEMAWLYEPDSRGSILEESACCTAFLYLEVIISSKAEHSECSARAIFQDSGRRSSK